MNQASLQGSCRRANVRDSLVAMLNSFLMLWSFSVSLFQKSKYGSTHTLISGEGKIPGKNIPTICGKGH